VVGVAVSVTIVQSNSVTASAAWTSKAITLASNPTLNNLLVVWFGEGSNLGTMGAPSGWSSAVTRLDATGTSGAGIFYAIVNSTIAAQTSWTFTLSASHSGALAIAEISAPSGWAATPLDVTNSFDGSSSSTALDSGSTAATAQADEFIAALWCYHSSVQTITGITSGYTSLFNVGSSTTCGIECLWAETSATGAQRAQGTLASGAFSAGAIAAFKPVVSGTTNITVNDSGSDTETFSIAVGISLAESGSGVDTPLVPGIPISVADSGTGTDTVSILPAAVVAETGTGTETLNITVSVPLAESGSGVEALANTGGAGTFAIGNAAATSGLAYPPQRKLQALYDGSLLALYQSAVGTLKLAQLTNPGGNPTITTLTQTFSISGAANIVGDLLVVNGGSSSDVWVTYGDNSATVGVSIAHATYDNTGWTWDNTGSAVTLGATWSGGFQLPSAAWTGTYLIVASRLGDSGGNFAAAYNYTTTKNGSAGWQTTAINFETSTGTSHAYPHIRHDPTTGCTVVAYSQPGDVIYGRVLPDSSTPVLTNWSAHVALTAATIGVGAANFSMLLDTANARIHLVWQDTTVTNANPKYATATYTSTAITAGSTISVGTTAATATGVDVALDAASPPNAYVFWGTGATGAASDIDYVKVASPYGSGNVGTVTNLTNNTATDNAFPHVLHDQNMSGYAPVLYAHAVSPWAIEYDNTIAVVSGGGTTNVAISDGGSGSETLTLNVGPAISESGTGTETLGIVVTVPLAESGTGTDRATLGGTGIGIGTVATTTYSQTWSGGPTGSPGTETAITYVATADGGGWRRGIIATYGGMLESSIYEVDNNVAGTNQTSLSTSTPDGAIHWLEQNGGGGFAGSEDLPFTLTELAPTGIGLRKYYKGTFGPDPNGFNWQVTACIYPGDPGYSYLRFDCINPSGSAITLSGSDGMEIALIGGLQQADSTWNATNGKYGTVGGTASTWPTASGTGNLITADPDYVMIAPASGSGITVGRATVKQKAVTAFSPAWSNPQLAALVNASRLKLKLQGDISSFPGSTTSTVYLLDILRRGINATDVAAMAADYQAPGTPTMTTGTFTSFSYDEGAWVFAAVGNAVGTTLDLSPTHVTVRYKPRLKVTNWTDTGTPLVTWGGTALTANTDFLYFVDTTNHILYLLLYYDVVTSGATTGQRNNAAIALAPSSATVTISDSGTGTDSVSVQVTVAVADSGTATETQTIAAAVPISQTGAGTETLGIAAAVPVTESGVGTEAVAGGITAAIVETGGGTEQLAIAASVPLTESGTGTDTVSVAGNSAVTISDTGTGSDVAAIAASIALAESGTGTEALGIAAAIGLTDIGTGVEQAAGGIGVFPADSGVGVEQLALSVSTPLTESGVGTDQLAVGVSLGVAESGAGTDTVSVGAPVNVADVGAGVEALAVQPTAPVSQSGTGIETLAVTASVPVTDSGHGVEAIAISVTVAVAETAHGAETVLALFAVLVAESGSGAEQVSVAVPLLFVITTPTGHGTLTGGPSGSGALTGAPHGTGALSSITGTGGFD
jgi:hypothetical protein